MYRQRVRTAVILAFLIVACSSSEDEDKGCSGEVSCTIDDDGAGFTGPGVTLLRERDHACVLSHCEAGWCKATYPKGTPVEDDREGDCSRAQCDGNGFIEHVYEPTDIGSLYAFECHEWRCEDILSLTARAAPTSVVKPDGSPCSLSGTGGPGVCKFGTCVSDETDSGIPDSGADADAGPLGDGVADATTD